MDLSPGGVDRTIRAVTKDKLKKSVEMANILNARGIVCHGGYNKWYFDGRKQVWLDASSIPGRKCCKGPVRACPLW